jgi:hypothetical protein
MSCSKDEKRGQRKINVLDLIFGAMKLPVNMVFILGRW